MDLMAGALAELGSVHALVVHGEPGMDEISPLGCTRVLEIRNGEIREWTIDPASFDLRAAPEELTGGEPEENAARVIAVLDGSDRGGARSAVLLNAAAAIYVGGISSSFAASVTLAASAIDSGNAMRALTALRDASAGG
jgi:anthranilate phosphoribosyltransferase